MFIRKEDWEKLISTFKEMYASYDMFGDNGKDILDDIDIAIDNIEKNSSNKMYVVTNNAVVDDEIDYSIYGVAINKEMAKQCFEQAVKDAKCDADFDNINAININDESQSKEQEEWYYDETDDSFELYLNGEYNSNNFSIRLIEYNIEPNKKLESEIC